MTALILDAGALVAVDRGDRAVIAMLKAATLDDILIRTNPLAIAQVWRDRDGRHARLGLLLRGVEVLPVDDAAGRAIGELLGRSGTRDVVDASLVLLARPGDLIATSDLDDMRRLAEAAGTPVSLLLC